MMSEKDSSSKMMMSDADLVDDYLRRLLNAAKTLATNKPDDAAASPSVSTTRSDKNVEQDNDDDDVVMQDSAAAAAANFNNVPPPPPHSSRLGTVDPIARQLLLACRPDILASSTSNLPLLNVSGKVDSENDEEYNNDDDDVLFLDDDDDNEEGDNDYMADGDNKNSPPPSVVPYQTRRIDYLRQLLRAMAPIQLDVAAHVATVLQDYLSSSSPSSSSSQSQQQQQESQYDLTQAAFILFSVWLPVAPHITPIVSSLLSLEGFQCPLPRPQQQAKNDSYTRPMAETSLLIMEACHNLTDYYYNTQRDYQTIISWWDWSSVFAWLTNLSSSSTGHGTTTTSSTAMAVECEDSSSSSSSTASYNLQEAMLWHAVRTGANVLDLRPAAKAEYIERYCGGGTTVDELVPWVLHPWAVNQQECVTQRLQFLSRAHLWNVVGTFNCPTALQVRNVLPLHHYLVDCGRGIVLVKRNAIQTSSQDGPKVEQDDDDDDNEDMDSIPNNTPKQGPNNNKTRCPLIRTATTARNISLLAANLCVQPFPPPILLCGPGGAGKSSLVRELARLLSAKNNTSSSNSNDNDYHHDDDLLEIHVDEEMDTKTLVGSYTTTDIPGEFSWRPGALTLAARQGKWVLLEDLPQVPIEIQASLVQLFKDRLLPLGNGKVERVHANFRLFATMTTISGRNSLGKRLLHPDLWAHVHVQPLPFCELQEISHGLYPNIPDFVVQTVFRIFKALDDSGRQEQQQQQIQEEEHAGEDADIEMAEQEESNRDAVVLVRRMKMGGRAPSVRDLFKVLSRIAHGVLFEQQQQHQGYALESQRMTCLQNVIDVFAASCPDDETRRDFMLTIAAPAFNLTADLAMSHYTTRRPTLVQHATFTEIGRARIHVSSLSHHDESSSSSSSNSNFAATGSALRLMESIGLCISENEPVLLVGETGGGKTTILQQLARLCGRELIVQNLSLQTDSTDLLGGYRPLEIRHIARRVYQDFVDLFVSTFSRKQNADFLSFTATALAKSQWKKLSQCFRRAAKLGLTKVKDNNNDNKSRAAWERFSKSAEKFEQQRIACDSGLAFVFTEGALVDAIRKGKWVLLDEINLASSETLQRLCGLLDDATSSITLTERGDAVAVERHADFRLFGAMNPATDSGKKDLSSSVRSRFTELYIDELLDPVELRAVAGRYLSSVLPAVGDYPPDHSQTVITVVDLYLQCRNLANISLVDGGGHRPRYTLRTLSRALTAARTFVTEQRVGLNRALYEGFELAFQGPLEAKSLHSIKKVIYPALGQGLKSKELDHPGRRPGSQAQADNYVLIKPFWIRRGLLEPVDWSEEQSSLPPKGKGCYSRFVLTPSTAKNVRRLARAIASGPWPILLEGATSTGKTTLVEYIAARCGHKVVRINNHEHTDVQEYTGGFAADSNGFLSFRDGLLVQALRNGHWVILDELNLAPSEVLEALNRLLDDNRELYLAEVNETVKPHPDFRLFATQNPSGAYGGRKPLSRAFRNRFVELHISDIPSAEMVTILEKRCGCPPSHAKILVAVMNELRQKRSTSGLFLGKDGYITPRDLLRWAERQAGSKLELAQEGYMLLAERLRTDEEKMFVQEEIEKQFNLKIKPDSMYYDSSSQAMQIIKKAVSLDSNNSLLSTIAPTRSLLRLLTLVLRCMAQKEPVLLVGETGCGKTTAVQLLSYVLNNTLHTINCHATTETSDILGGLRPVRGRAMIETQLLEKIRLFFSSWPDDNVKQSLSAPELFASKARGTKADIIDTEHSDMMSSPDAIPTMVTFARKLWAHRPETGDSPTRSAKRQKTAENVDLQVTDVEFSADTLSALAGLMAEIEELSRRYNSLFEWTDGPLVRAMKEGHMVLLDEMSLAEDAVLERLNSVLEPSRTLVLAEKGAAEGELESAVVIAEDTFLLYATMNPGGDFGKRELSPALRSRFTEIWIPPVTDHDDVKLVVERALSEDVFKDRDAEKTKVVELMLAYVEWFDGHICGDPTGPCAELTLSLRDILTWARFIVVALERNRSLDLWEAYFQGACLMHLDGLGLGTALAKDDAATARRRAESFLKDQMQPFGAQPKSSAVDGGFQIVDGRFGTGPFWIETGSHPILPNEAFNLEAPTTTTNIFRVLRAMQLSKPVLLEGSPGVGKTSLIAALASACGHKLVRINLSEQTDMSDLLGGDLPVPEADSGASGAVFKWCDGVLLSAIKSGAWVLLDELNLASQSVLEGLNSCLDHRASIFIPELGRSFDCPSTFRVFAAQNPLGQGGGRKGLPKSFLNRFTKVYVDALCNGDLRSIVCTKFPTLPQSLLDSIVSFNSRVHHETCELHSFGLAGSPWEFNLRDVFRWCELLVTVATPEDPAISARFVRDLYQLRFRTANDRDILGARFEETFKTDLSLRSSMLRTSSSGTGSNIQIGTALLERLHLEHDLRQGAGAFEEASLISLLEPMEAVARCIERQWPCILVGEASSGKASLIRATAQLSNATLLEVALSPSSDVSELVGTFEQTDSSQLVTEKIRGLVRLATVSLVRYNHLRAEEIVSLCQDLSQSPAPSADLTSYVNKALSLVHILTHNGSELKALERFLSEWIAEGDTRNQQGAEQRGLGHFEWKDGVLVQAMRNGHWLHLKNANLCPSSVLDRLNPVLEPSGYLLLAECGGDTDATEEDSNRGEIRCHPNFRVFLSMNPEFGEVSRAMRNRCVEIALLSTTLSESKKSHVDSMDCSWKSGLRVNILASTLLQMARKQNYSPRVLKNTTTMVSCLISRGTATSALELGFDGLRDDSLLSPDLDMEFLGAAENLPCAPLIRSDWALSLTLARSNWDSRPLQLTSESRPIALSLTALSNEHKRAHCRNVGLRNHLLSLFIEKCDLHDVMARMKFLDTLDEGVATSFRFLVQCVRRFLGSYSPPQSEKRMALRDSCNPSQLVALRRAAQLLREKAWGDARRMKKMEQSPSVLAMSLSLREGVLDQSSLDCPVTPSIYPFFRAVDRWSNSLLDALVREGKSSHEKEDAFEAILCNRDLLWNILQGTPFGGGNGLVGFQEIEFVVQWTQFKKALTRVESLFVTTQVGQAKRTLDVLVDVIDQAVFGRAGRRGSSSLWRTVAAPLVPRKASWWNVLFELRELSGSCSLSQIDESSQHGAINLASLVSEKHSVLIADNDLKRQILAALSMLQISSVEESWPGLCEIQDIQLVVDNVLRAQFANARNSFAERLNQVRVDSKIETVQNTMHLEALGEAILKAGAVWEGYNDLCHELLSKFASIQVSPCSEFWCEQQETKIIVDVCKMMILERRGGPAIHLAALVPQLRALIDVGLTSQWTMSDLCPFQTLLWAAESGKVKADVKRKLLRGLLSSLSLISSRRTWNDASSRFKDFSSRLELPVLIDSAAYDVDQRRSSDDTVACPSDVPGATIFSLVGQDLSLGAIRALGSAFSTIENFSVRQEQASQLLEFLALRVKCHEESKPWNILYFLVEIIDGLRDSFEPAVHHELTSALYSLKFQDDTSLNGFIDTAETCSNQLFRELLRPVVHPLLMCLSRLWSYASCTTLDRLADKGLAQIYLGLLRFHLLLPDSPLDPGREPVAKVSIIDRRLSELQSRLDAERLDEGMSTGDFDPDNAHISKFLGIDNALRLQRSRQQKKIIERIEDAPPFVSLYREITEISSGGFLGVQEILELMERVQKSDSPSDEQRVEHWQTTLEAFCSRILQKFAAYEEIITPLIHAASTMSDGVRSLASIKQKRSGLDLTSTLRSSLQFPMACLTSTSNSDIEVLAHAVNQKSRTSQRCTRSIAFSVLARLVLRLKLDRDCDKNLLECWSHASALLMNCVDASSQQNDLSPATDDEALEQQFRAQFPDHREEFRSLIKSEEEEMEDDDNDDTPLEGEKSLSSALSDTEVQQLCFLHRRVFFEIEKTVCDHDRVLAFKLGYNAALNIHDAGFYDPLSTLPADAATGHAMALSIAVPDKSGNIWCTNAGQGQHDFHKDPNPSETMKAAVPLGRLIARIAQLLSAFPGNDILIPVCKLAERLRKLDLLTLSVGKLMTGLELILKSAQDWEQYASDRVRIGKPLDEVSALVANYRKLELKSWALLLNAREEQYAKRGRQRWIRLYAVFKELMEGKVSNTAGDCEPQPSNASQFPPRWVWKSISSSMNGTGFTQPWPYSPEDTCELMKTLDTFILTSPLGELRARLDTLEAFASQFSKQAVYDDAAFPVARALASLCNYYGQYSETFLTMISRLRQPYEARLKEEVKLAKWDEQSYYALAESTERNHRKLMKILREYDEILDMNVGQLLERELQLGVGSEKDSPDGKPSIPTKALFFSLCTTVKSDVKDLIPGLAISMGSDRIWTDATFLEASRDDFLSRLALYSKKVDTFLKSEVSSDSPSSLGRAQASDISSAIFERIESLRSEKTTRPMKERALVDLFRELKQNGYQSMKWSVPPELRRMNELFQIPTPALPSYAGDTTALDSSEKYYQRCLSEIGRLRAEVMALGSKHLTKRQMDMMLGLGEHGLLLILQQRSMISHVLAQRSALATTVEALSQATPRAPSGRLLLCEHFLEFERLYSSSIESIRQLRLLVMSAKSLMKDSSKEEWARDTVAKISDFLLKSRATTSCLLVTDMHVDEMEKKKQHLVEGAKIVKSCILDPNGQACVPSSAFQTCILQMEAATQLADQRHSVEAANRTSKEEEIALRDFASVTSRAVETLLLAAQTWMQPSRLNEESQGIWDCHREATCDWAKCNMKRLNEQSSAVLECLQTMYDTSKVDPQKRSLCVSFASDLAYLYSRVLALIDRRLHQYLLFYRSTSKLHYVLLRVFRVLVSKGFCSDKAEDVEGDAQAEGDTTGMTFEDDKAGTGMGEGEGSRDVTDELESEEQLLGLKNDENDEVDSEQQEGQKLEKEEAEKGMEMEADFDGEMHDLPDDNPADREGDDKEDEDEEELDREMGDERGENEQVLDEKMWNEDDDDDDDGGDQQEEKLEKNSSVQGEATTDEMITQEDEKDRENGEKDREDKQSSDPMPEAAEDEPQTSEAEAEQMINEDKEDDYEDSHGVDVRDERMQKEKEEGGDEMNIDEEPDDGDDGGDENEDDAQEEEDVEHPPEDDKEERGNDVVQDESGQESDSEQAPDDTPGSTHPQEATIEEDPENADEPKPDDSETAQVNQRDDEAGPKKGLGVRAHDGQDAVDEETPMEQEAESGQQDANEDQNEETNGTTDEMDKESKGQGGSSNNGSRQGQTVGDSSGAETQSTPAKDIPNPFRNPGDVAKFWHRKLNIIHSKPEAQEPTTDTGPEEPPVDKSQEKSGDFEYVGEQEEGTTQALGEVDDEDKIPQMEERDTTAEGDTEVQDEPPQKPSSGEDTQELRSQSESMQRSRSEKIISLAENDMETEEQEEDTEGQFGNVDSMDENDDNQDDNAQDDNSVDQEELLVGNQVVSDLSRLNVEDGSIDVGNASHIIAQDELQQPAGISTAQHDAAKLHWSQIQSDTYSLSRRLCEKLRLVMEPLVASKLRGDYRTGKRINMKRVIGYIASGYRKDKIWLRRTKPAKRNYRVLLAVDDSESMLKTGAGEMALKAMATLATGMSQLEIGEVGVASFGSEMNLLHPFGQAFTSESGVNVTQQFSFKQQRTRTALCVESALMALEEAESGGGCDFSSMQLVFLISDGRIERDSRATLRRLLREMMERNILMAMIIVEGGTGDDKKKESIVNMKEVTFEKGKPRVKPFMEDYPFPYYIVLEDMRSLPEVLGDALRQWFEMLARLQTGSR